MPNPPKSQCHALLGSIFAITAFILMWIGSIRCNFIKFASTSGTTEPFNIELGMWYYQYWSLLFSESGTYVLESCHTYPDGTDIDAAWKAARSFGIITFIFSIFMLVVACISGCACNKGYALTHVWEAPCYLLTAICQGLVLLLLSSNACNSDVLVGLGDSRLSKVSFDNACSMASGAKLIISATVFWFSAAVASFLAHKAEKAEMSEAEVFKGGESDEPKVEREADKPEVEGGTEKAVEEGNAEKEGEAGTVEKAVEQEEEAQ